MAVCFHCLPSRNTQKLALRYIRGFETIVQYHPLGMSLWREECVNCSFCSGLLARDSVAQAQETRGMEVSGQYQYIRIYPGGGAPSSSCQGAGARSRPI